MIDSIHKYWSYGLTAALVVLVIATATAQSSSNMVPLTLYSRTAAPGLDWPVSFGVPFPEGELLVEPHFWLEDASGTKYLLQQRISARWLYDDSIRWMLFDAIVPLASDPQQYQLRWDTDVAKAATLQNDQDIFIQQAADRIDLKMPPFQAVFDPNKPIGLRELAVSDKDGSLHPIFPAGTHADFIIEDGTGITYRASLSSDNTFSIEEQGPVRVVAKSEGWLTAEDGAQLGRVIQRIELFSGLPFIRVYHSFIKTADSEQVQYRNIRMEWPFQGNQFHFDDAPELIGNADSGGYLIQYRYNNWEIVADDIVAATGDRSKGQVAVGDGETAYTMVVQDFWETFPNEIEVQPNLLSLHFWPRHSRPAPFVGDAMTPQTVGHLGWVHGGEYLDFSIPEEFYSFSYGGRDDGILNAVEANALGIARTVEYGIFLDRAPQSADLADAFRKRPRMIVAPAWLAASGAFWQIAEREEQYAELEDALERTLEFLPAMYERIGDYGKWNYGAFHQTYLPTLDSAHLHRIWKGIHHGAPRWPWLQAVRSGKPEHYDWAIDNSNHTLDVSVVNWEDPEYNAQHLTDSHNSANFRLKYLGGLNRYKGTVHWYAGQRMFYNAIADFALWHYYLTGYQRAWDVVQNMGEFLIRAGGDPDVPNYEPYDLRIGTGRGDMAVTLYRATGDERFERVARNQMAHFIRKHHEDPENAYRQFYYAPFFERYFEVFEDEAAAAVMVEWAYQRMAENIAWSGRDPYYNLMALAYRLSGDPSFLEYGLAQARLLLENSGHNADPILEGVLISSYPGNPGYTAQQWGDMVRALHLHQERSGERLLLPSIHAVPPMRTEFRALRSASDERGHPLRQLVFVTRKQEATPLQIEFPLISPDPLGITVVTPDGQHVETVLDHTERDKHFQLDLPANATAGDYWVRIRSLNERPVDLSTSWPLPGTYSSLVVEMPFDVRNAGRFYFQPQPRILSGGILRLRTAIRPRYYRTHALYYPDGSEAFRQTEQGNVNGNFNHPIRFNRNQAEGLWLYSSSGLINSDGAWIEGDVLPFAAFSQSEFFVPEHQPTEIFPTTTE